MKNTNKHTTFEEQFKRRFEGAELSPPSSIWANIEKTLPKHIVVPFYRQNWFRAAATVVLILGFTTWFTYPEFSNKTENSSQRKEQIKDLKTKEIQKAKLANNLDNSEFQNKTTTNSELEKNTQLTDNQGLKNNKKHFSNSTTEKLEEKETQSDDEQELINKNKQFTNSAGVKKLVAEIQKNKQLTTTPLIANASLKKGTDEQKIEFLKTLYLALAKAKLDTNLPLAELILNDFTGFPIIKKEAELKEKRFLLGLKVAAGNLNLNYSGDNSQNAVGLEKTLAEYDTSTKAIDTDLFEQLRKAKGTRWSVGMDISYLLSKKWSINSGFAFRNNQYSTASQVMHTKFVPKNGTSILGDTLITEVISNSLTHKWQTLSVPLTMSYHIGSKKLTGSISFGLAANVLISQNQRAERLAYAYKLGSQKKTYFNSVVGFKLNYKLSPKWYWSAGVDYQNALGSILNEDRVSLRPDTYQANTGLYFSF